MNIFLLIALYALQNSESAVLKQRSDYRDKWFNGEKNRLASFPTAEKESDPAVGDDHNNLVKDKQRNNWGDNIFQHYGYGEKNEATVENKRKEKNRAAGFFPLFLFLLKNYADTNAGEKNRLASSPTAEKESNPAIGDDHNNLVKDEHNSGSGTSRQKRNLLTDLIQPHMLRGPGASKRLMWLQTLIQSIKYLFKGETDPDMIYIQDMGLKVWNDVLEEHQVMKIGTSLYSMCLEECKKFLGTHEHCHTPCSKFANSFGRRQKTDETDENLKEALERLLEEYLREEEGQS